MACFSPLKGYRSRELTSNGKRRIVFQKQQGYADLPVSVPCGQCIGCRLERSRQWAMRCVHEASLYDDNCFITLTFNDDHLPTSGSVDVRDHQLFMKRLRKHVNKHVKPWKQRFYLCGEYGEKLGRPHYHAILFDFDFADKELFKIQNGNRLYVSRTLEELWPFGFSLIGDVTFESAAYVARYIMKKVNGSQAEDHYKGRHPEYTAMSRSPGIAAKWFEQYRSDVYPGDFVVLRGRKMRPPRFYDRLYEVEDPDGFTQIRRARKLAGNEHADNNTPERLKVREKVQEARLSLLPRKLEGDL